MIKYGEKALFRATSLIEYCCGYKYRRLLCMRGHMTYVNRKKVSANHIAPCMVV